MKWLDPTVEIIRTLSATLIEACREDTGIVCSRTRTHEIYALKYI